MRKDTLGRRFAGLNRPATVSIKLPLQVLLRVEGAAKQDGISRAAALEEAVLSWSVRRERSLNRQRRLELAKALRQAADHQPIAELLERFRRQMGDAEAGEHKDRARGLTGTDKSVRLVAMRLVSMRERREALGLTRQQLAQLAGCSLSMLQMLEGGYKPVTGRVMGRIEKALAKAEREANAA